MPVMPLLGSGFQRRRGAKSAWGPQGSMIFVRPVARMCAVFQASLRARGFRGPPAVRL
jgi:hypothetical protein